MKKKDNGIVRTKEEIMGQLGRLTQRKVELVRERLDDEEDRHDYNKIEHCEINGALAVLNWLIGAEDTESPSEAMIRID